MNAVTDSSSNGQVLGMWQERNKENLQFLSRQYFKTACKEKNLHIILSGYVTDEAGMQPCIDVNRDIFTPRPDLDSVMEVADCRIIPHVENAALHGIERVIP